MRERGPHTTAGAAAPPVPRNLQRHRWARLAERIVAMRRDVVLALIDAVLAGSLLAVAVSFRFGGVVPEEYWRRFLVSLPAVVAVVLASNCAWGLYNQMWRHASAAEARRILGAGASSAAILLALASSAGWMVPRSVVFMTVFATTAVAGGVRFHSRLFSLQRREAHGSAARLVVLGAGARGAALVRELLSSPDSGLLPVAVLDDDPRTHGRSCAGVPVVGPLRDLATVARRESARQAVLAIGDLDPATTRLLSDLAAASALSLRVLPPIAQRMQGQSILTGIRDLRIEDLLGRRPVPTDLAAVRSGLCGRRVLVTGAGGSIGSEIARQVAACDPAVLLVLDHDETHLHELVTTTDRPMRQVLADIRDREVIRRVFELHRPEIVFHAAAHKHVPVLEDHIAEAVRTNVVGTQNLLDAAEAVGTRQFVFISTDKAVAPSCVMGASKRVAEGMVLGCRPAGMRWCAVRFGNVLGSRGSVIPTFLRQLESGQPLTITDPRMTRFFMTIPEAVQLVMQASTMAEGGEVFVLEMGEPVRILDLAHRMISLAGREPGRDVEIRVVGIRPGEKLHEILREPGEELETTAHPSVRVIRPRVPSANALRAGVARVAQSAVRGAEAESRERLFRLARAVAEPLDTGAAPQVGGAVVAPRSVGVLER